MAKATFDIQGIRTEATRGLHAGVGAADLALEAVRDYVAGAQKRAQKRFEGVQKDAQKAIASAQRSVRGLDLEPQALRTQATHVVSARVEELSKDARARRTAIEKRVAELQADTQKFWVGNVETATGTYVTLAQRGEKVVKRIRKETASTVDPGPVSKATGETTTRTAPARKPAAKQSGAKKATAKKVPAKKAPAKKAPARKATATKAPAAG